MAIKRRAKTKHVIKKRPAKVTTPYNRLQRTACAADPSYLPAKLALKVLRRAKTLHGSPLSGIAKVYPKHNLLTATDMVQGMPTAIVAMCLQCAGGGDNIVAAKRRIKMCAYISCPLWAFRLGTNPFHNKKV